jgi:hypothetical protein
MLNYAKTASVVSSFYEDCFRFWLLDGKDTEEARQLAKEDLERITTNPFSPHGQELDTKAKNDFLAII